MSASRDRWLRLAVEGLGVCVMVRSLVAVYGGMYAPIGIYDEGILLTNAHLMMAGQLPYRDFYTNYPPGTFWLLSWLFGVLGPSVMIERWFGLFVHAALALASGRLAGRLNGLVFSGVAAGLVSLWLVVIGIVPFTWLVGLTASLWFVNSAARSLEQPRPGRWATTGAVFGAISWFRHELWVYLLIAIAVLFVIAAFMRRRDTAASGLLAWAWPATIGFCATFIPFWTYWVLRTGLVQLSLDLFFDQVRYVMPARVLPLPALLAMGAAGRGMLPAFLTEAFPAGVMITLAGPICVAGELMVRRRDPVEVRLTLALLGCVTVAVLPQMLGRTDLFHAVYTVPAAIIAACAWPRPGKAGTSRRSRSRSASACRHFAPRRPLPGLPSDPLEARAFPDLPRAGPVTDDLAKSRRTLLAFIARHSPDKAPIFVGARTHRRIFINEVDLYFLADRLGGTRYLQFDPNVANREDVQRQMIADLEDRQVNVVVLSSRYNILDEPNDARKEGAGLLDDYLASHFEVAEEAPPYRLLLRR